MKIWVLTKAINNYNQVGEYLVSVFLRKPNKEQLYKFNDINKNNIDHILNGGGRVDCEDIWFYLSQIEEGNEY